MKVCRSGFSLFEVMIAMAICVAGLALILQMLGTSETLSRRAELHLQAQQHCRNLLNCYLAGILEPTETRREELAADTNFWYAVQVDQHVSLPLEVVIVEVWPKSPRERHSSLINSGIGDTERTTGDASRFRLVGNRPLQPYGIHPDETSDEPHTAEPKNGDDDSLSGASNNNSKRFR